jgi:predicted permease
VKRADNGSTIDTRALECAITAVVVLLAADAYRTVLGPLWRILSLLFGT